MAYAVRLGADTPARLAREWRCGAGRAERWMTLAEAFGYVRFEGYRYIAGNALRGTSTEAWQ